jgi:hypothetical protein
LRGLGPNEIRNRLQQGSKTFNALEKSVKDPQLKEMSRELLISTLVNTSQATLDEVARQGARIGDLDGRVQKLHQAHTKLADFTIQSLDRQQQSINALSQGMQRLDNAVAAVDERLQTQERNMDFVQGFVFSKMSPAEKAAALRSGYMGQRFSCPAGQTSCEQNALKQSLIEQFEAEAFIEKTVQQAGAIVRDANSLLQISNDLGIRAGPIANAVQYGTLAFNAFSAAASGNYLGAVASLTGAFGRKKPDPQMAYMKAQFEQINRKLDQILENQRKLSEQITALSGRLDAHMERLNERFDNVEFHLAQIRQLQAMQLNLPWLACQQLYNSTRDPARNEIYKFDHASSTFRTTELASAFGRDHSSALNQCTGAISLQPGTFALSGWFGNFLNSSTRIDATDADLRKVFANREDTWSVVSDYLSRRSIPAWQAFRLYSAPAATIEQTRRRLLTIPQGNVCDLTGGPLANDRLGGMLCEHTPGEQSDASRTASTILSTPMVGSHAIAVAGWILVEQALVDVHQVRSSGALVSSLDLIRAPTLAPISKGEQHVERALVTLDAAVANESMLSGDITVDAVVEALRLPASDDASAEKRRQETLERIRRMLLQQPALARNVGMVFLRERLGIYVNGSRTAAKPRAEAYETALRMAEEATGGNQFALFETLFGPGLEYRRSERQKTYLVLMPGSSTLDQVVVPMPEPTTLAEGRLQYPHLIEELAAARDHVGVRYMDYNSTRKLSVAHRRAVTASLARAEASQ